MGSCQMLSLCQLYFAKFANSIHIAISLFCYLPSSLFLFANATLPNCRVHIADAEAESSSLLK